MSTQEENMKGKKEGRVAAKRGNSDGSPAVFGEISAKSDLKSFLLNVKDKIAEESTATIYAMSAINHILSRPDIYSLLDNENKEIARDIWLRIKQTGLQLRNPPLLFGPDETDLGVTSR